MATTGMCDSFKVELMCGAHDFLATQSAVSCTGINAALTLTGLASTAGLARGMAATGTNVASGAVIASVDSASQVTVSKAHTGSVSSVTFTADTFKILLIKASPARTFDHTQTNIGTPGSGTPGTNNVGTDEASGTGYSSGGLAMTNVSPSLPGTPSTTATASFSPNPSWTSATITATAALIYNNNNALGAASTPINGRTVSVHDFGGSVSVVSGTLTLVMPTNDGTNAILRVA